MITPQKSNIPHALYDGDCGFCVRWVQWCQNVTQNQVIFTSFQTSKDKYPTIPEKEFKKYLYVFVQDKQYRGAEAIYFLLSFHPKKKGLLTLYYSLWPFRLLSDVGYLIVSKNRQVFSKLYLK